MRKVLELLRCPNSIISKCTKPNFEDIKLATWKQELEKMEELLLEGAPTHQNGETILHFATAENKIEAVEFIVQKCPNIINEKNEDGDTALMLALFSGNTKIIRCLINITGSNVRDNNGNTPFIIAAANGNIEVLEIMLNNCNNTMMPNFEGETALHRASYFGELEVIKLLLEKTKLKLIQTDKSNNNSLHMACMGCNIICIRYIINKVKEPHKLMEAVNKENKRPIELLHEMINKINTYKKQDKIISIEEVENYIFGNSKIKKV